MTAELPLTAEELTAKIKSEAQSLGFFACGMAKAEPVDEEARVRLHRWLDKGGHADMEYMTRYTVQRLDPRLLHPQTKTVVSLAMNYTPQPLQQHKGYRIAAYAYGKDYHAVVRSKLYSLLTFIQTLDERITGRVCCDTAPILERYWAVKAGLGWVGRHRQLIIIKDDGGSTVAGSMMVLGELLLNVELCYDTPVVSRCGTCRRCVDACPTKALSDDVFKAEECLSYQLIENRNALSERAVQHSHPYIYGCDRCQIACPWNRFATPTAIEEFQPSEMLRNMTDEQWEQLSEDTYRMLFKGSAVKRAKYAGLKRNIDAARRQKK